MVAKRRSNSTSLKSNAPSVVNLCHVPDLRSLLERHGLSPTKKWGQHFLVSENVVQAILAAVPSEMQGLLEVGPGPGVLTAPLSQRTQLVAVEVDPIAVSALTESAPSARVVACDALQVDLASLLGELPEPRAVVSNMPYNITGPLLTAFNRCRSHFSCAILMMQREVGDRLLAPPGDREMGSLSVLVQSRFTVSHVINAPGGAFYPPPKVDSVVLKLVPKPLDWSLSFDTLHEKLARAAFSQPRKTLSNNLKSTGIDRDAWLEISNALGWSDTIRPHQVQLGEWERLARWWDARR